MNFVSSFFNAGGWFVAIPFIVSRIYEGDALLLANITVVFYFGSLVANFDCPIYADQVQADSISSCSSLD